MSMKANRNIKIAGICLFFFMCLYVQKRGVNKWDAFAIASLAGLSALLRYGN